MPTLDKWEETMNRCRLRTIVCSLCMVLLGCAAGRASEIHRVVTGFAADNKSTALFDSRWISLDDRKGSWLEKQLQGLIRDTILGVVEVQTHRLHCHALPALGVVSK